MKKVLALLLTMILICGMVSSVFAEEDTLTIKLSEATDEELAHAADLIKAEQRSRLKTKVVPKEEEITIDKGKTLKLEASVKDLPEGVTAGKLAWDSADSAVATIANGNLKAVGAGTTTITCSTVLSDGTEVSAPCKVTVIVPIQSITLKPAKMEVMASDTFVPDLVIKPDDATNTAVTYESADESVVKVTAEGQLLAVAAGRTTVTVAATDGSKKSAKLAVTVTKKIGKYDEELTYQGLAWGSSGQECQDRLKELGIIDKETNNRPYSTSYGAFWPENDLLFNTYSWRDQLPVIFKDKEMGAAQMYFEMKKTVGGFSPSSSYLYFTNGIDKDGNVDPDVTQLVGVYFQFDTKHEKGTTIFKTLLSKMEEQYGEFTRYIHKDFSRRWYKDVYDDIAETMKGAKQFTRKDFSDEYSVQTSATCVLRGKNNTGIMISVDSSEYVTLYYGKTDTWDQLKEIQKILEADPVQKEDGGI